MGAADSGRFYPVGGHLSVVSTFRAADLPAPLGQSRGPWGSLFAFMSMLGTLELGICHAKYAGEKNGKIRCRGKT